MLLNKLSPKLEKIMIIVLFCLIAIGLIWQVINLSRFVPLHDWDEAIYAQVAKEWVRSPSLTLHYNGLVWFEKPPVPFVLMGVLMMLFGSSILPLRLVSAILGIITVVCVYLITQKITKRKILGLVASAIYITSSFFLDRSSIINVDIYLTLSWLLYIVSERLGLRMLAIVIGVGSKSLLGFIPLFADLGYELFARSLNFRKIRDYLIQIVIGSIWYLVMFIKFGNVFVQSHFLDHMISRITKPIELHFGDKFFYLIKIWQDIGIWSIFAVIGFMILVVYVWQNIKHSGDTNKTNDLKLRLLLLATPFLYLTLLTLGKSKLTWYVMPVIPFLTVFASVAIQRIQNLHRNFIIIPLFIFTFGLMFFARHIITQTFYTYKIPDKTELALCIDQKLKSNISSIAYLVSTQERGDAQVIEAANLQIGSSFIYGSAPAFVFYSNRPVSFYYSPEKLLSEGLGHGTLVVHEEDLLDPQITRIAQTWNVNNSLPSCTSGPWQAFIRDY